MRYFFLVITTCVLITTSASAQSGSFECKSKARLSTDATKALLADVQSHYSAVTSISSKFLQNSYLSALEVSELSSGTMKFKKGGKMRWDYEEPEKQSFVIDGKKVYFYQPNENQLVIDEFKNVILSDMPVAFLMGLGDLTRDFVAAEACETADGVSITLSPKTKKDSKADEALKGFKLLADPSTHLPIGARVTDVGGNTTAIVLKDLKPDSEFSATAFEIKPPKGTDVIDKRASEQ